MITHETVVSIVICVAAAILEGALTGGGVKERFAELRLPYYSPSFSVWIGIGIGYYLICFLLTIRLLSIGMTTWPSIVPFSLLMAIMVANGVWGYLFFRLKSPLMSLLHLIPYSVVAVLLYGLLRSLHPVGAAILIPYLVYLPYVVWWNFQVNRMNTIHKIL